MYAWHTTWSTHKWKKNNTQTNNHKHTSKKYNTHTLYTHIHVHVQVLYIHCMCMFITIAANTYYYMYVHCTSPKTCTIHQKYTKQSTHIPTHYTRSEGRIFYYNVQCTCTVRYMYVARSARPWTDVDWNEGYTFLFFWNPFTACLYMYMYMLMISVVLNWIPVC